MSALFTPLKVGSITISNRIGMSALTRNRSTNTVPNDIMLRYYVQRAKGDAVPIVTEGVLITRQGTEWPEAPGLWDKSQVEGWKKITGAIWHLGRASHPDAPEQIKAGVPVYAPSALSAHGGKFRFLGDAGYVTPTEIVDPTILIAQYKQAAINAKEAGFDGCTAPMAISCISSLTLHPTSGPTKWGGSSENRARFAFEIIKAFIAVYGPDVVIKLSPADGYNDMGMPLQDTIDTFGYLLREANKLGLAYVALTRYSPVMDLEFDGGCKKRATQHDVVEPFAPFLTNIPVFVNAGVTPAEAEKLVASGKVAGKELDNAPDWMHLYGAEGVDPALGYVDYKEAMY
ncbi:hypothetical protein B0H19DRAFT_1209862 [Mycena capillaripes]|nr:hypothetical protein B0H19DRAFT_1209862 [Mycena capillaripes]